MIKNVFSGVAGFFTNIFSSALNGIKKIWENPGTFFDGVWKGIKGSFAHVTNWFKDTFSKAWQAVKDVFSRGGKIFTGIKDGISGVFKMVVNKIIDAMNGIIKKPFNDINGMLNKIRDVKIMKWHPFHDLWEQNPLAVP